MYFLLMEIFMGIVPYTQKKNKKTHANIQPLQIIDDEQNTAIRAQTPLPPLPPSPSHSITTLEWKLQ